MANLIWLLLEFKSLLTLAKQYSTYLHITCKRCPMRDTLMQSTTMQYTAQFNTLTLFVGSIDCASLRLLQADVLPEELMSLPLE